MDTELFELCKEVYSKTEWGVLPQTDFQYAQKATTGKWSIVRTEPGNSWPKGYYTSFPLYTSDYLLEKLPEGSLVSVYEQGKVYYAMVDASGEEPFDQESDTPLKALLKLVIALDDAGVKL